MADIIDSSTEILDKIDEQLDGVISYMDNLTELLNEEIEKHREEAQEFVNEKASEFSAKLTEKLQPIRDKIVDIFSSQFAIVKEKVDTYTAPISSFVTIDWSTGTVTPNIPVNLGDVVNAVKGIIMMLIPSPAIEFALKMVTEIFPKIATISTKIQTIATYQPQIDIPDVEMPPLTVDVAPITLGDIIGSSEEETQENT